MVSPLAVLALLATLLTGVWPLDPEPDVVHDFDPPAVRWESGHRGVDLAGRLGQPVRSTAAGTVTFAATLAGRGVVVVEHGDVRTTYEPVTATVERGQSVGAGEPIGRLQLGASHCFPRACLHWGARQGETYLDPLTLVQAPIRLLPLSGLSGSPGSSRSPGVAGLMPVGGPFGMRLAVARW